MKKIHFVGILELLSRTISKESSILCRKKNTETVPGRLSGRKLKHHFPSSAILKVKLEGDNKNILMGHTKQSHCCSLSPHTKKSQIFSPAEKYLRAKSEDCF
jgi:hypothetical protein